MRNKFQNLLAIFFILYLIGSPSHMREALGQDGKTFLWKAQSGASTVYILGSIHLLKKESYPLSPKIETAFDRSDTLVVEANVQDQSKMNTQAIMEKGFYPPNDSITAHVSPETYESVKSEAAKMGLPLEMIDRQKPWILSMSLEAIGLMKLGYDPAYGADNYFLSKATGRKKILELESLDEQINLLANLSDREQELLLLLTLKDLQNAAREVDQVVQAWKTGDT
ncbi:MAG: TraB/GumN family protein, partial [Thermodesulfobacteriota bacterium]